MWNDLKRGHFLDARSRLLTLTLLLRSNHLRRGAEDELARELRSFPRLCKLEPVLLVWSAPAEDASL